MTYIDKRMAMIFNEWARRYSESPESFTEVLDADGKPIEDYGECCVETFKSIADEMDAKGLLPTGPDNAR
ncbi:MAG: hypothetical protein CMK32_09595 [Porticoccaceae bacterium]|nr:hypothetical protein [Porticoccaceae bacterium]